MPRNFKAFSCTHMDNDYMTERPQVWQSDIDSGSFHRKNLEKDYNWKNALTDAIHLSFGNFQVR